MSARRTQRDQRRRSLGQNFLADQAEVRRLLDRAGLTPGELVVEFGSGRGALTFPIAAAGARVLAVERDPAWARRLRDEVRDRGLGDRIRVVRDDLRRVPLPQEPYRVISSVPFSATTALLSRLLDDPRDGPWRADLLVQWEVARKRAEQPASTLRSAAWAPWWTFELGPRVRREAFRPVPRVDGGWLTVLRRDPAVLPTWLATGFGEVLRPNWSPPQS